MVQRVTEPFTVWRDGMPIAYTAGKLVDDKDPILKSHGHLFENVETAVSRRSRRVETATADPGEPRSLTPPAEPAQTEQEPAAVEGEQSAGEPFDPAEHSAPEVLSYLDSVADPAEVRRVLDAEEAGQARKGITGKRAKLLNEG